MSLTSTVMHSAEMRRKEEGEGRSEFDEHHETRRGEYQASRYDGRASVREYFCD